MPVGAVSDLSQVELPGLGFDLWRHGSLSVSFPLKKGTYSFPGPYQNAEIQVLADSTLEFSVGLGQTHDGRPEMLGLRLEFKPAIWLNNPQTATHPASKSTVNLDRVADWVSTAVILGIELDHLGKPVLKGYLDKGIFGRQDLDELVGNPSEMPKIDMASLFDSLSQIVDLGQFRSTLWTDESAQLKIKGPRFEAWSDRGEANLLLAGRASLKKGGSLELMLDPNKSSLKSPMGEATLAGEVLLSDIFSGRPEILARASVRGNVKDLHAFVEVEEDHFCPVELGESDHQFLGQLFVHRDASGKTKIMDASTLAADVGLWLPNQFVLKAETSTASIKEAELRAQVGINFGFDDKLNISDGAMELSAKIVEPTVDVSTTKGRFNGEIETSLSAHKLKFDSGLGELSSMVKLNHRFKPADEIAKMFSGLPPVEHHAEFELRTDGRVRMLQRKDNLSEVMSRFISLDGNKSAMVDPKKPPVGEVGSPQLKAHLEALTRAEISPSNQASLLIDGTQSLPKRLQLIDSAKKSICLQALIFKDDEAGMQIAKALVAAKKRGVDVKVIVDALGNISTINDLFRGNKVYELLQKGGVDLQLHNNFSQRALREIFELLQKHPELFADSQKERFTNPKNTAKLLRKLDRIVSSQEKSTLTAEEISTLAKALNHLQTEMVADASEVLAEHYAKIGSDGVIDLEEMLIVLKHIAHLNHRWHEKYLVADGQRAIMGGMNVANEYLLGEWRDTDILIEGPAAGDAYACFATNWHQLTGNILPLPPKADLAAPKKDDGMQVQIIHHRPGVNHDHHTENFMIENIKALKAGQRCYIANAYFLPTGAMDAFKVALIDAAKRGVDVRIVTNSETTSDSPQVCKAAIFTYRELLASGVRIFERTGKRTMHQKVSAFGGKVAAVGSWNTDNRSASINSESMAAIYNDQFAKQVEEMILADMSPDVAREIKLEDIATLPWKKELEYSAISLFANMM